jgi:hypothetical protein
VAAKCSELHCPKFLSLQRADLYMVKGRHEIRCDLSRFFFRHGVGRILFTGLKNVFQRAAVFGRASVSKQFEGHGWNQQPEGDQDCSEVTHAEYCNATEITSALPKAGVQLFCFTHNPFSANTHASFRQCFQVKRKCALPQHPEREALTNKFGPLMGGCTCHQGVVILRPLAGRCLLTRSLSQALQCPGVVIRPN